MQKERSCVGRLRRLFRYRLLIPLERSLSSPEEVARGTSLGLGFGLTPTVGFQIMMLMVAWCVMRFVFRLRVDIVSAIAWTWVSNPLTMIPMYFVFYLTGELMLFRTDEMMGYEGFSGMVSGLVSGEVSFLVLWAEALEIVIPMFLGSVPWSLLGFVCGYLWGKRFMERLRARRLSRA